MLDENGVDYEKRNYVKEPLTQTELRALLKKLGLKAKDVVRKNDKAYKALGLTGSESDTKLIPLMAKHPTLLQRPIGIQGRKAAVGRPIDNLLDL